MNARAHAGAGRDSLAVLGVLAASLVSARNPAVPELAVLVAGVVAITVELLAPPSVTL